MDPDPVGSQVFFELVVSVNYIHTFLCPLNSISLFSFITLDPELFYLKSDPYSGSTTLARCKILRVLADCSLA